MLELIDPRLTGSHMICFTSPLTIVWNQEPKKIAHVHNSSKSFMSCWAQSRLGPPTTLYVSCLNVNSPRAKPTIHAIKLEACSQRVPLTYMQDVCRGKITLHLSKLLIENCYTVNAFWQAHPCHFLVLLLEDWSGSTTKNINKGLFEYPNQIQTTGLPAVNGIAESKLRPGK